VPPDAGQLARRYDAVTELLERVQIKIDGWILSELVLKPARHWVRFFSSVRTVILAEPSQVRPILSELDVDAHDILQLLDTWRHATSIDKALVVNAIDLWLLRLRLEWNIEEN
jgi:hypothetical protein